MKRTFNRRQKFVLRTISGGHCENCGIPIDNTFHADHVVPWSRGGETTLSNGQALCPPCNLKKGNKMEPLIIEGLTDRRAQVECIGAMAAAFNRGEKDFLAELCVGAGKTNIGLAMIRWTLQRKVGSKAFVIVPSDNIRDGWMADAKKFGLNFSENFDTRAVQEIFHGGFGERIDGIVISYQTLAGNADLLQQIVSRVKGDNIVVFDEVHHQAEGLAWGEAAKAAFANATYRIGLSGTPYRHDVAPIPWVEYDAEGAEGDGPGVAKAHYSYRFKDGIKDKIVAAVFFRWIGGQVNVLEEGTDVPVVLDFDDEAINQSANPVVMNNRLRGAVDVRCPILMDDKDGLVAQVVDALIEVRQKHKDAGAAIVCDGMGQLKAIKAKLEKQGYKVLYTTANEASHDKTVVEFNNGNGDVLLSINQLSEGVTIKRLRVLGFATVMTTQLFFTQVAGRLVRLVDGIPYHDQHCIFIAPKDPRFVAYAEEFQDPDLDVEQRRMAERKTSKTCPSCGAEVSLRASECDHCGHEFPEVPKSQKRENQIDGIAYLDGFTGMGKTYTQEEVQEALEAFDKVASDDFWWQDLTSEQKAFLYFTARRNTATNTTI